jgi:hypothetical protein
VGGSKRRLMKLHNEKRQDDGYFSPNISTVIKSRMLRWAGHVERTERTLKAYKILEEEPEGQTPLRRNGAIEKVILI